MRILSGNAFIKGISKVGNFSKVIGCYFQVVYERGDGYCRMESYKQVYMIGHAIDTIENALVVLAESENIHIEVALVCLCYSSRTLVSTEDNVVDEFGVCHSWTANGTPFQGAVSCCCRYPGVLATLVPSVTERRRFQRPVCKFTINK